MIDFYLMTEKGYNVLSSIIGHSYVVMINEVIIGEDKSLIKDYSLEIKELCIKNNLPFRFRKEEAKISNSLYSIAISWRWIINDTNNLIVIHDSLLPKYRGFAPLVNALINGEKLIGVTALFANEEYDKGDIIIQVEKSIVYPIKISKAIEYISECYIEAANFIIEKIFNKETLPRVPQINENATYSLWLDDENYHINWANTNKEVKRFIDATGYPYKSAYTLVDEFKVSILEAEEYNDVIIENREPGKVIFIEDSYPIVVCGVGLLKIKKSIKRETGENFLPLKKFRTRFR